MTFSLVLDYVSDRYNSPKEFKQAMTLMRGAMMATDTELVVSFDLHFYRLNSAWLSQLDEEHGS
jgi:hypothetical protein